MTMPTEDGTAEHSAPWLVWPWTYVAKSHRIEDADGNCVLDNIGPTGGIKIVTACNSYEPMREALAFYAAPENHGLQQHGLCFASAVDIDEGERARAALSTLHVNDRHHSGSDNERLRKALSKIEVWADDRSHLNNVFETIAIEARAALNSTGRQTSDDVGILRDALRKIRARTYSNRRGDCELNGASVDEICNIATAALKGVPQPVSHWTPEMKRAAMTDARNVCELADTLREIEKQCIQADDPEHHTLSLVKHLARHALARLPQPASEAGKLSTDEVLP